MRKPKSNVVNNFAEVKRITVKPDQILIEGDVVVLNSGGPQMAIENITGDFVKCLWFDIAYNSATFHKACLTRSLSHQTR